MRKIALCVAAVMLFSCDPSLFDQFDNNAEPSSDEALREELEAFNGEVDQLFTNTESALGDLDAFEQAATGDDDDALVAAADAFVASADGLEATTGRLQEIEDRIQTMEGQTLAVETGIVLYVLGLAAWVATWRSYSEQTTEAKNELEDALDDLVANEDGALERVNQWREALRNIALAANEELITKIVTTLIPTGIDTSTLPGVLVNELAGNEIQDRLRVLSISDACKKGEALTDPDCNIGLATVDDEGIAVTAGPGRVAVIFIQAGFIRIEYVDVEIPDPPDRGELDVTLEPVDEATLDDIGPREAGGGSNSTPNGDPNNGGGGDSDGDGVPDGEDLCPDDPDPYNLDRDGDGIGGACDDDDCPEFTYDEDGCPNGEHWSRFWAYCIQTECPAGWTGDRTSSGTCICETDEFFDPCNNGYVLFCTEP